MKISPSFSFTYQDIPSSEYMKGLSCAVESRKLDEDRTQIIKTWNDSASGLQVRCVTVEYADFPAVEWTVYFKNTGGRNTGMLKDIRCLDTVFRRGSGSEFVLHGNKGDWCVPESYEPYTMALEPGAEKRCAPQMGKSTGGPDGWPYYNLKLPGGGVFIALGWPGQWSSTFVRDKEDGLRVTAGQQLTNLYLMPGEEIRTPLVVLLTWEGEDVAASQNIWRRWFWKHNTPRVNGEPPAPLTHVLLFDSFGDDESVMWENAKRYMAAGVKPDVCWRDAGWYPHFDGPEQGDLNWTNTGTWDPDPQRFPEGFRRFSDWAHKNGMKFLLWFEPERAGDPESFLWKQHPEWLLDTVETEEFGKTYGKILDLGNEQALSWLIGHVDGMIKSEGIDWYREDMNGPGPLLAWRRNDAPDRQGITENFYVQGHLTFWDELIRRNPGLRIDTCASGGRRNDLETMRRAVPLLRSDYQFPDDVFPQHKQRIVFEANQCHTWGLSAWFPYYGSAVAGYDPYRTRSFYMPAFSVTHLPDGWEKDDAVRIAVIRIFEECRKAAPLMLADYYPLTPYSLELNKWIAWQFNRPEEGDGMVQAFRRSDNGEEEKKFRLSGLDVGKDYLVTDSDAGEPVRMSGKMLMEDGLTVKLDQKPGAALIFYQVISE